MAYPVLDGRVPATARTAHFSERTRPFEGRRRCPAPPYAEGWATPEAAQWLAYRKEGIVGIAPAPSRSQAMAAQLGKKSDRQCPVQANASFQLPVQSRPEPLQPSAAPCEATQLEAETSMGSLQPVAPDASVPSTPIPRRHRRPHILQVELDELLLNSNLLDLQLSWYETATYIVTLHPSSVKLPYIRLPSDVPCALLHAEYLASQPKASQPSRRASVGNEGDGQVPTDSELPQRYPEQARVSFAEQLATHVDQLDSHFVLFLWCRRSSMFSESTVLLGCRPLPLRDSSLYARLAAWDILDLDTGEEVGQVRLRIDVLTVPGPIRLPHLSDVTSCAFTLNWSSPLGMPITGYVVVVRVRGRSSAILSEETSSNSFVVDGLLPETTYVVDIRAANEVGWGEGCQLEASTLRVRRGEDGADSLQEIGDSISSDSPAKDRLSEQDSILEEGGAFRNEQPRSSPAT